MGTQIIRVTRFASLMRVGNISGEFSFISWPKPFEFGRPRRVLIPDKPRISGSAGALGLNAVRIEGNPFAENPDSGWRRASEECVCTGCPFKKCQPQQEG